MAQLLLRPTLSLLPRNEINTESGLQKLFLEMGERHFAYLITDLSVQVVKSFQFYSGEGQLQAEDLQAILEAEDIVEGNFSEVVLVNNTKDFVLLPSTFHKDHLNESILETVHGDIQEGCVQMDDVHQWELINVHRIQNRFIEIVQNQFPDCKVIHVFTPLLKNLFRSLTDDNKGLIKLYFYPSNINVIALKGDQLLFAQQFYYETTEDVIYHLLNVADKFRMDVTELLLQVSGSIDDQSSMWKELLKYFLQVEPDTAYSLNLNEVESSDLPPHYFTPLLLVPQCV